VPVAPEFGFICLARLVEQQRGDEQHEEDFRVQRYGNALVRDEGHDDTACDLDERQRHAWKELVYDRRCEHGDQKNESEFERRHGPSFLSI